MSYMCVVAVEMVCLPSGITPSAEACCRLPTGPEIYLACLTKRLTFDVMLANSEIKLEHLAHR